MNSFSTPTAAMQRALEIAQFGTGYVEPNPAVGAVLVDENLRLLAEGWHPRFGGPHAEVVAMQLAKQATRGATLFVTLEPCSHFGKTPPCADAVIAAGIKRVLIATQDPAKHVAGTGIQRLQAAGLEVEVGLCETEAKALIAPFAKLFSIGKPWVHAKWAMTLDGKIATRTGSSQWITNAHSRHRVHQLRGKMDAIIVGAGTVLADDPSLTVRPLGPRTPLRIVLDRRVEVPLDAKLVQTAKESPVMLVVGKNADSRKCEQLQNLGVEVLQLDNSDSSTELNKLLTELGRRQMTNLLVEGGSKVLGSFWDQQLIDEVHCFIGPKLIGGEAAINPFAGTGLETMPKQSAIDPVVEVIGSDVYIHGRYRDPDTNSENAT